MNFKTFLTTGRKQKAPFHASSPRLMYDKGYFLPYHVSIVKILTLKKT